MFPSAKIRQPYRQIQLLEDVHIRSKSLSKILIDFFSAGSDRGSGSDGGSRRKGGARPLRRRRDSPDRPEIERADGGGDAGIGDLTAPAPGWPAACRCGRFHPIPRSEKWRIQRRGLEREACDAERIRGDSKEPRAAVRTLVAGRAAASAGRDKAQSARKRAPARSGRC